MHQIKAGSVEAFFKILMAEEPHRCALAPMPDSFLHTRDAVEELDMGNIALAPEYIEAGDLFVRQVGALDMRKILKTIRIKARADNNDAPGLRWLAMLSRTF